MPTYDYVCDACGKEFELEQRITEDPIKKCPKCGKAKARRQISNGGRNFILKGGGWYSDLYSSPSSKPPPPSESSAGSSSTSTSTATSTSTDSTAAAAPTKTEAAPSATKSAAKSTKKKK